MTPWQAALLGIVQGLSEFLPISSSAHLALAHWLFDLGDPSANLAFDVALHLGTLLAVLIYFRDDWLALGRGSLAGVREHRITPALAQLGILVVASVPAALAGALLHDSLARLHDYPPVMAGTLASVGVLLVAADRRAAQNRERSRSGNDPAASVAPALVPDAAPGPGSTPVVIPDVGRALVVGSAQALSLVPGVSRSGITMAAGLLVGLDREAAARFSFLLGTPAIVGAIAFELGDIVSGDPLVLAAGLAASAISGYLAIGGLLRYLTRHGFVPFAIYRIALAVAVLWVWFARGRGA